MFPADSDWRLSSQSCSQPQGRAEQINSKTRDWVAFQLVAARTRVLAQEALGLHAVAVGGPAVSRCRDVRRLDAPELREVFAWCLKWVCRVNRLVRVLVGGWGTNRRDRALCGHREAWNVVQPPSRISRGGLNGSRGRVAHYSTDPDSADPGSPPGALLRDR